MGNKNIIVRSNIKQPSPKRYPTEFVLRTQSYFNGIQQSVERGKEMDLPIMNHSVEDKIPLIGGTRKPQPPSF